MTGSPQLERLLKPGREGQDDFVFQDLAVVLPPATLGTASESTGRPSEPEAVACGWWTCAWYSTLCEGWWTSAVAPDDDAVDSAELVALQDALRADLAAEFALAA